MRSTSSQLRPIDDKSRYGPVKIAVTVLIYVALCMLVLIFSPPDYAARSGLVQTKAPQTSIVTIKPAHT